MSTLYNKTDNFQYPKYITNDDEMPGIGTTPRKITDMLQNIKPEEQYGGATRFPNQMFNIYNNQPDSVGRPQINIGGYRTNHPYFEGGTGPFLNHMTSEEKVKPMPVQSTFVRKQYANI